jgi:hypothetical protein
MLISNSEDKNSHVGLTVGDPSRGLQVPTLSFRFSVVRQGRPTVSFIHTLAQQIESNGYEAVSAVTCLCSQAVASGRTVGDHHCDPAVVR